MSAMLIKRIEVRKLSKLGCNIQKFKNLIRNASSLSVRSTQSISKRRQSECVFPAGATLQDSKSMSASAFPQAQTRLAVSNTMRATAKAVGRHNPAKRTSTCDIVRGIQRSASQSAAMKVLNYDTTKPTVIVDHKEGPCKRSLRYRKNETKIVPQYLRFVNEDEVSAAGQTPRHLSSRSLQMHAQRHDVNDKVVYEVDDSYKECLHTVKFGKRDRRALNAFQHQLEEARLQQSLSYLNDRRQANVASRKGNAFEKPKVQTKQVRTTRSPAAVTLKELHEARFGRTLNTLADKKIFNLSNLYTHDYNKFPIEDEMQVQAKLLARQKANKLKAQQQQAEEKEPVVHPVLTFGRRRSFAEATHEKAKTSDEAVKHQQGSMVAANHSAAAAVAGADASAGANNSQRYDPNENIYKKFLRVEEEVAEEPGSPRFDQLYYHEQDHLCKNYPKTWRDYPEAMLNVVPEPVRLIPPPFKKRPKDERPTTAKAWGDVNESSLL